MDSQTMQSTSYQQTNFILLNKKCTPTHQALGISKTLSLWEGSYLINTLSLSSTIFWSLSIYRPWSSQICSQGYWGAVIRGHYLPFTK